MVYNPAVLPFDRDRKFRGEPFRRSSDTSFSFGRAAVDPALIMPSPIAAPPPQPRRARLIGWLVAPAILASIAAAFALVLNGPDSMFGIVFGAVVALGLGWILVCSLVPAKADRKCPQCGKQGLVRLDARTTRGVRCTRCSFRDETASSFLLAEEEGVAIEPTVLHERDRRRG
jgi:DNA-directed RNA polymerase subunit RPC12/RpoP